MSAVFGNVGASAGEVNDFHSNSDVDKSTLAQHHTLGPQPNQASPGDHNHDGRNSKRLSATDLLLTSRPFTSTWSGTGLAFTGNPTVSSYLLVGTLCHFRIRVNCTTVTNFGTGQYFLTLPFAPKDDYVFRDGGIHGNANSHYALMADAEKDELQMSLWHPGPGGQDALMDHNSPHTMSTSDYFYISGTYEIAS
jgi:hypothetical protein